MKTRFKGYKKTTEGFLTEILVVCPKCSKKAIVTTPSLTKKNTGEETKVICVQCGFDKILLEKPKDQFSIGNEKEWDVKHFYMNIDIDPYFGLPLWLQEGFPQGLLWAYNIEHLIFLEHHIAAELRERSLEGILSRSIESRLPKWMSTKENSKMILRSIENLKKKE